MDPGCAALLLQNGVGAWRSQHRPRGRTGDVDPELLEVGRRPWQLAVLTKKTRRLRLEEQEGREKENKLQMSGSHRSDTKIAVATPAGASLAPPRQMRRSSTSPLAPAADAAPVLPTDEAGLAGRCRLMQAARSSLLGFAGSAA